MLTYNLYTTEAIGGILQRYPIADPRLYPLFKVIRNLLDEDEFLRDGGMLGSYCVHSYQHTRKQTQHHMPFSLLGTDAIMFSVFKALGLKAMVGPVLGDEAWDEWAQIREEKLVRKMYEAGREEESDEEMGEGSSVDSEESNEEDIEVEDEEDDTETARVGKAWWKLKMVATDSEKGGVFKVGGEPSNVSVMISHSCNYLLCFSSSTNIIQYTHFLTLYGSTSPPTTAGRSQWLISNLSRKRHQNQHQRRKARQSKHRRQVLVITRRRRN
jgi:hypothetical protein